MSMSSRIKAFLAYLFLALGGVIVLLLSKNDRYDAFHARQSIALTIVAAQKSAGASVVDRLGDVPTVDGGVATPDLGESLLPPSSDEAPLVPSGD